MNRIFKVMALTIGCLLLASVAFGQYTTFIVEEGALPGGTTYPTLAAAIATAETYANPPHKIMILGGNYSDAGLAPDPTKIDEIYGDPDAVDPIVFTGDGSSHFMTVGSGMTFSNMTVTGYDYAFMGSGVTGVTIDDCMLDANVRGVSIIGVSTGNAVTNCVVTGQSEYGVVLGATASANSVTDNCFVANADQGYDSNGSNTWDYNYYSDDDASLTYYDILPGAGGASDADPWRRENQVDGPTAVEILGTVAYDFNWVAPGCADAVDLAAYEFTVHFNPAVLQYESAGSGYDQGMLHTPAEGALYTAIDASTPGLLVFAAANFDMPGEGDGRLAFVEFTAIGEGATWVYTSSEYLDPDGMDIPAGTANVLVTSADTQAPEVTAFSVWTDAGGTMAPMIDPGTGEPTFSDGSPNGGDVKMFVEATAVDAYALERIQVRVLGYGGIYLATAIVGPGPESSAIVEVTTIASLAEGSYTLQFRALDDAGHWSDYADVEYTFDVDHTGPDAANLALADPDGCADVGFSSNEEVDVSWDNPDGTSIGFRTWEVNDPGWSAMTLGAGPISYPFPDLVEGSNGLYIQQEDAYGNVAQIGPTAVMIDLTAPAPSAPTTTPAGTTGSATFSGDCNLDAAGGALYAKAVLGAAAPDCGDIVDLISGLGSSPRFDFEIIPPDDGTYDVTFASMDAAGNVGSVSTTIDLDLTATEIDDMSVADATGSECSDSWTVAVTVSWTGDDVADLLLGTATGVYGAPIDISAEVSPFTTAYTIVGGDCMSVGPNTIFAVIEDGVGNASAEMDDNVDVDCLGVTAGTMVLNTVVDTWTNDASAVAVDFSGMSMDANEVHFSLVSGDYSSEVVEAFDPNTPSTTFNFGTPAENTWVYLYAKLEDCADRSSAEVSGRVAFDLTDPVLSGVEINGGAAVTNNATVSVDFVGVELHKTTVYISEAADMSGATSYPWGAGPYSFDVTGPDGPKNVFVQVEDFVGNVSTIETDPDGIELDGAPPLAGAFVITSANPMAAAGYTNSRFGNTFAFTPDPLDDDVARILIRNEDNSSQIGWFTDAAMLAGTLGGLEVGVGTKTVEWYLQDEASNQSGPFYATIDYNPTAPPAPSNATGTPGGSVTLAWDAVPNAQYYHIRYNFANEYPTYASGPPPFPGSMAEGIFEAEVSDAMYEFEGPQDDLFAFGIWTLSNHGLWSAAPNQEVLEHNYRLGDFVDTDENPGSDGCLSFDPEFVALAVVYNTSPAGNANLDIAPTSDGTPTGCAQPDDAVDFEDLVVFAQNYMWSRNEPACDGQKIGGGSAATSVADLTVSAEIPTFARIGTEFMVPISINSTDGVSGFHLIFDYDRTALELVSVKPGEVYDGVARSFFYHDADAKGIDISSAVLSNDFGAGEIAVVTFRTRQTGNINLEDQLLDVRGWNNEKANVDFELAAKGGTLPTEFTLSQNYPNPFNPNTTIELALPEAAQYRLTVFNVIGQIVDVFEGYADAGIVTFDWDASKHSSGVYLYRVTAGSYSAVRKMVLLK